jgi:hypothetical protein
VKHWIFIALCMIGASFNINAAENGFFCKDCSYNDAKELAKKNSPPLVRCIITRSPTEDYIEECSSLPKQYFVVNETTRQIFAFNISHLNQKHQREELTLTTTDRTLNNELQQNVFKALDAKLKIPELLWDVSQGFNKNIEIQAASQAPKLSLSSQLTSAQASSANGCSSNQHAQALKQALNEQHRFAMQEAVRTQFSSKLNQEGYLNLGKAFRTFRVTSIGISGGQNSAGFSIGWDNEIAGHHYAHVYKASGNSADTSESRLVWSVTLDTDGTVSVKINKNASGIDGVSLGYLLDPPPTSNPVNISSCLADILAENAIKTTRQPATATQIKAWYGNTENTIGGYQRREPNDPRWICQYTFLNRAGEVVASFLSLCF